MRNVVSVLKNFVSDPNKRFGYLNALGVYRNMSDEAFLKKEYRIVTGRELNLLAPKTLNEKLQWLKIHNRKDEYTTMVDKVKAKEYVSKVIGEKYIIPTIGVWSRAEDIDFDNLPDQFVLKCNHNSGKGMYVCKDKTRMDVQKVRRELKEGLKQNYYLLGREWPYKNVERRILAEKYLINKDGEPIADYKFYCYGGEPQYFMYSLGESEHNVRNHKFDMNMRSIDHLFKKKKALEEKDIQFPDNMEEMISIVKVLCKGHPHIRIDLYNVDGEIFFGEMTFYSGGGYINIDSEEYSQYLADLIDLREVRDA